MRHLVGVLLAIVLAAAVFFAASWGYVKLLLGPLGPLPAGGGSLLHHTTILEGLGALAGVGLVAGLLIALPRVSPLASGLPGLVLLAWTGLYIFSVRRAVQYIPLKTHAYGMGFQALLFDGILAMAGLAMIIPLFVPSRWRLTQATSAAGPVRGAGFDGDLSRLSGHPDPGRWGRAHVRLGADQATAAGQSRPRAGPLGPRGPRRSRGFRRSRRSRLGRPAVGPLRRPGSPHRQVSGFQRLLRRQRSGNVTVQQDVADPGGHAAAWHQAFCGGSGQAAWNCSASVDPASATVSAFGEMAEVTRSK